MESVKLNEIKRLSPLVRQGTQAYVYHDKKYAYKIYKPNNKTTIMFNTMDVDYQLERLSNINLDSYVTPKFRIVDNRGFLTGYGMDYIKGKTLNRLNLRINTNKFIDDLKRLEEDTYIISEEKYMLRDKNDRNILYSEATGFSLIDLDYGIFADKKTTDEITKNNIQFIKDIIKSSVFGTSLFDKLSSYDTEFEYYLYNSESIYDFIKYLSDNSNKEKTLIKDIRKKKKDLVIVSDYYGRYL